MLRLIQVGIGAFGWSWAKIGKESKYWEAIAYVDLDVSHKANPISYPSLCFLKSVSPIAEA